MIEFETDDGYTVLGEATTSWSFVGAGLRLSAELLGPEYSMSWNTLDSGLKLFFSREVQRPDGRGPGREAERRDGARCPSWRTRRAPTATRREDRHFVRVFLGKEKPRLTFDDGLEVVKVLMTAYASAEAGRTLDFPPKDIESFVPKVAKGEWRGDGVPARATAERAWSSLIAQRAVTA